MRPDQSARRADQPGCCRRSTTRLRRGRPDNGAGPGDDHRLRTHAATASFYRNIPFGHVEAGLHARPALRAVPPEANPRPGGTPERPTSPRRRRARDNLIREGKRRAIPSVMTGNTVIDALLPGRRPAAVPIGDDLDPTKMRTVLVTAHRRDGFGEPIRQNRAARPVALHEQVPRRRIPLASASQTHSIKPGRRAGGCRTARGCAVRAARPTGRSSRPRWKARHDDPDRLRAACRKRPRRSGKPVLVLRPRRASAPEAIAAGVARLVGHDPATIIAEDRPPAPGSGRLPVDGPQRQRRRPRVERITSAVGRHLGIDELKAAG